METLTIVGIILAFIVISLKRLETEEKLDKKCKH